MRDCVSGRRILTGYVRSLIELGRRQGRRPGFRRVGDLPETAGARASGRFGLDNADAVAAMLLGAVKRTVGEFKKLLVVVGIGRHRCYAQTDGELSARLRFTSNERIFGYTPAQTLGQIAAWLFGVFGSSTTNSSPP